jgi:hypothetical protein
MRDFFRWRPTLSGSLAIANCLAWLVFVVSSRDSPAPDDRGWVLIIWTAVFLGFPLGWLVIQGHTGGPTTHDIYWTGFIIGINSFVWGLMMAHVVRSFYRISDEPEQDAIRGCDEMQIPERTRR